MQAHQDLLNKLKEVVNDVGCDDNDRVLRHIQERLVAVVARGCDHGFLACARLAFVRPDVLFQAFHTLDQVAVDHVHGWVTNAVAVVPTEEGTMEALGVPTNEKVDLAFIAHELHTPIQDIIYHVQQQFLPNVASMDATDPASDCHTTHVTPEPAVLEPLPKHLKDKLRHVDEKKRRSHIKRVMAQNLRDSFF